MFFTTLVKFSIGKSGVLNFLSSSKNSCKSFNFYFCLFYIFFFRCGPKMRSIQSFIFLLRNHYWCNMVEVFFLELKVEGWKLKDRKTSTWVKCFLTTSRKNNQSRFVSKGNIWQPRYCNLIYWKVLSLVSKWKPNKLQMMKANTRSNMKRRIQTWIINYEKCINDVE
jgi:hypothetical protein